MAAGKIPLDGVPEEAVVFGIDTVIRLLKIRKMPIDDLKKRALVELPWSIDGVHGQSVAQIVCQIEV